ncbi:sugar ABC transporter substrate-binding protein [Actinoplanes sp. NPDC049596]|uniref:sugar ABC transporter substrate-binding protein n=1 Tax=unclassified Actinoplanes TaxID=2626549 RepID=UPI0034171D08
MKLARRLGTGVALAAIIVSAGCTKKSDNEQATTGKGPGQVKIALVPGGAHPYFQPWKTTAAEAKSEFKLADVTFNETSGWDQTKQNDVVKSLAAQGYNAFGIFGVAPENINSTFEDLKRQGFAVGSLASCPAGDVDQADFCLSTDVQEAAYKAAKAAIDAMGGKGNLVHLTGNKVDSNTQRRIAGVEKAVGEAGGQVKILQVVTDIDTDLQTAQKAVADLLAAKGSQINAIVNTAYNPAVAAAEGVKQAKLPIKVIAIDDDKTILDGIKDGSVAGTVLQNPVGQALVGSYALMKLSGGCTMKEPGVIVDSGSFVVTKDQAETYENDRQAKTDELRKAFDDQYLVCN